MAEFSLWTRVVATLLLVAFSLAAWKWLQSAGPSPAATPSSGRASAPKSKKKTKKRAAKKAATAGAQDNAAPTDTVNATASAVAVPSAADAASESEDESDEDEGLSAVQILARRKFKVKALGGKAVAAAIAAQQAKLPKYEAGQQVLARFQGGKEWFPATIAEVRRGGEYNLKYDDGEVEYHVSHKLIKPRTASAPISPKADNASNEPASATSSHQEGASASAYAALAASALPPSSDEGEESEEDDGWEIVGAAGNKSKSKKPSGGAFTNSVGSPRAGDGLTKRQRENRRKKERQREMKELAREQAQENGLHAKWGGTYSKMKYVPPPTQA